MTRLRTKAACYESAVRENRRRGLSAPVMQEPIKDHCEPSYTLEIHAAETRARVGEKRWAELMAEWE